MHSYLSLTTPVSTSPFDRRFRDVAKMDGVLAPSQDLSAYLGPIRNQGNEGSCSAFSGTSVMEVLLAQHRGERVILSPAALYEEERIIEGDPTRDLGARLRDTQYALKLYGVPPEADDPYTPQDFLIRLTPQVLQDAARYRISDGFWAPSLDEILHALNDGYPVQGGIVVYPSFESPTVAKSGTVPMPGQHEKPLGGHAVALIGYDLSRRVIHAVNSWGVEWGNQGHFTLPFAYMESPRTFLSARVYSL